MKPPPTLARAAVLISSLTLLVGYVAYSHVTPNSAPPDPLGLNAAEAASSNTAELTIEPEVVEFEGFINYGTPAPPAPALRPPQELRIISSKVINQPIFSVNKDRPTEAQPPPKTKPKGSFFSRLFKVRKVPYSPWQPSPKKKPQVLLYQFGVQLDGGLPR